MRPEHEETWYERLGYACNGIAAGVMIMALFIGVGFVEYLIALAAVALIAPGWLPNLLPGSL